MPSAPPQDLLVAQWYDLFLDLWNHRYRLEQQPRDWLETLSRQQDMSPIGGEDRSVMVTSLLLRARTEFVALDRITRESGETDETGRHKLRLAAQQLHDRWVANLGYGVTPGTSPPPLD